MSPTSRSIAKLKSEGYMVAKVEHWNSFTRRRQDLWQFGDILAIRGHEALIVQTTSGSNVSARLEKISSIPAARVWLESPNRGIVVHGWSKRGPRGKRKLWTCREVRVQADWFQFGQSRGNNVESVKVDLSALPVIT